MSDFPSLLSYTSRPFQNLYKSEIGSTLTRPPWGYPICLIRSRARTHARTRAREHTFSHANYTAFGRAA